MLLHWAILRNERFGSLIVRILFDRSKVVVPQRCHARAARGCVYVAGLYICIRVPYQWVLRGEEVGSLYLENVNLARELVGVPNGMH